MTATILKPTKGKLLVSVPFLNDYFFGRSVVLITEHNKEGSVGLIINKTLDTKVSDAVKEFDHFDAELYMGGPVENDSLFYIHTAGDIIHDSIKIMDGLFWGGNFETVKMLVNNGQLTPNNIKFFVGYSGWAPEQLHKELKENSWVITKDAASNIMKCDKEVYWKNKLRSSNMKEYSVWADFPVNPSLN